jgi:Arc/MetJ-type ribon-helix-helix transcriptional regulator
MSAELAEGRGVHVTPRGGRWAVEREGGQRASSLHDTQAEAEKAGRETARREHVEFYLHGRDGQILERDSPIEAERGGEPPRSTHAQHKPAGMARKVSVSMPDDLTAAVQRRVGRGKFSQYVTEAVARQLELDLLAELSDLLTAEHGPVPEEYLAEARAAWPDSE